MKQRTKIQVIIITYNRPNTVVAAIDSVLGQTYPNVELIVSDNSTNEATYNVLSNLKNWGSYMYVRRNPPLSGVEHLVRVMNEVTSDYFMVFHDDDKMLPDMVEELYKAISADKSLSAVGSNAYAVKNGKKKTCFLQNNIYIPNGEDFIKHYVDKTIAPFPSYMYNRQLLGELRPDYENQGGKYCDVSFLFNVTQSGPIVYVGKPLMVYNIHPGQDSGSFDFLKHIQLTNYLLRNIDDRELLNKYRLYQIYRNAITRDKSNKIDFRPQLVRLFCAYSAYTIFIKYSIRVIQDKIIHWI